MKYTTYEVLKSSNGELKVIFDRISATTVDVALQKTIHTSYVMGGRDNKHT